MSKLITLRYNAKCVKCKQTIPAGTRAYWHGSKRGSSHLECQLPAGKKTDMPDQTVIPYSELREHYLKSCNGETATFLNRPHNIGTWDKLIKERRDTGNWTGSTVNEMVNWLNSGYMVPGLDGVDSTLIPGKPRRKLRFSDEGDELLLDLAYAGVDEHFMEWEKRISKPSLAVKISISFSAIIDSRVVNQYQSWVARMLQTIDSFGLDMQVDLISPGRGQSEQAPNAAHTVLIRVKESGEATDFSNWSPMFSPGGFRHMVFLGIVESSDRHNHDVSYGLGHPINADKWDIEYNGDENTLTVTNHNSGRDFPEFEMTQKLIAILSSISGN